MFARAVSTLTLALAITAVAASPLVSIEPLADGMLLLLTHSAGDPPNPVQHRKPSVLQQDRRRTSSLYVQQKAI